MEHPAARRCTTCIDKAARVSILAGDLDIPAEPFYRVTPISLPTILVARSFVGLVGSWSHR